MKSIIHLSDLHVGHEGCRERFFRLIDNLKSQRAAGAGHLVLVITGDLIEDANHPEDFQVVRRGLDDLRQAGFQDILVAPGNHDYGSGSRGDKKNVTVFRECFYADEHPFPRVDIIEEVAFIGLDSMAEELNWDDEIWAEGELGEPQLSRLESLLQQDEVRRCQKRVIYLHHHPFDYRPLHQLKDSKRLRAVLIRAVTAGIGIDAILYGHNHEGKSHNGEWGIPRCYDAGSATLKPFPFWARWLMPWYRCRSAIRQIHLDWEETGKDRVLHLLD